MICKGVWEAVIIVYSYGRQNKQALGIHSGIKLCIQGLFQRKEP